MAKKTLQKKKPDRPHGQHLHAGVRASNGHGQSIEAIIRQSPLPTPEELTQYAVIDPDFPNRFFEFTEKEQAHRHELDNKHADFAVNYHNKAHRINARGQICALVCVFCVLGLGGYAFSLGFATQAATIITVVLVGIAIAFIKGQRTPFAPVHTSENEQESDEDPEEEPPQ